MTENEIENEQRWDELEDIYKVLVDGTVKISVTLSTSLNVIKGNGYDYCEELITTVSSLTGDIKRFVTDLENIHSQHSDKSGLIENSEELALCIDIFNEYVALNDKFKAITVMPMLTVTDYTHKVMSELKAAEDAAIEDEVSANG